MPCGEVTPPPLSDPIPFPGGFLLAAGEGPLVTWLGTSIVRRGGRKWSASHASQRSHSAPAPQQGRVTVNKHNYGRHWGGLLSNRGCTCLRVSLWPPESVTRERRTACYFYHHIGPQFSRSGGQKYLSAVESQHERMRWWNSWPVHVKSYQRRIWDMVNFPNVRLQILK